jgi:hypothetical protein
MVSPKKQKVATPPRTARSVIAVVCAMGALMTLLAGKARIDSKKI